MTDDQIPPASELPNVVGLTGTEAVFRILAHTREPMKMGDIHRWLEDNRQPPLTDGQIAGAFWRLTTAYENVVEKPDRGTYRIHDAWDDKPLDQQELKKQQEEDVDYGTTATAEADERQPDILIPCYGLYWHRDQIAWDARQQQMLGSPTDEASEIVDFANQWGVYILYYWPNITYVGRTTRSLYARLKDHIAQSRRANEWDRFSWFGLRPVDENGNLAAPHPRLDMGDIVAAFETLLITTLSPPFNDRSGERLGRRYLQVPDPIVEDRKRKALAEQIKDILERARFD